MRPYRLAALVLVVVGLAGSVVIMLGWNGGDGTALFPLSVLVGIMALAAFRPRSDRPRNDNDPGR